MSAGNAGRAWAMSVHEALNAGKIATAERILERVGARVRGDAAADMLLAEGRLRMHQGRYAEGARTLEACLRVAPASRQARLYLFACYRDGHDDARMLKLARRFRETGGDDETVLAYLAFMQVCDWDAAAALEPAVIGQVMKGVVNPAFVPTLFLGFLANPRLAPERIAEIHRAWGRRLSEKHAPLPGAMPRRGGRLRVGYLSADFYHHSVGKFVRDLITGHDRSRFEVYCYAHLHRSDHYTEGFRRHADHFIEVTDLSARELAARIRADGIHVLVELGGHTGFSRLESLAFRPAPVQISWLGYPATTGLETVDFKISDAGAEPANAQALYSEELLFMPKSYLCMSRLPEAPLRERAPAEDNGHVTFGTFNDVRKLNPDVVETWAEILRRVENARLLVKGRGSDSPIVRGNLRAAFARHGIESGRLQFMDFAPTTEQQMRDCLAADIALDTFPYNGTTTTFETLWLGIPVVALVGNAHVARTSCAIMRNIGFEATCAADRADYVEKAVALAENPGNLTLLRKSLPTLLRYSPLCHADAFVRDFEELLETACEHRGLIAGDAAREAGKGITVALADGVRIVLPDDDRIAASTIREFGDWHEDEIRFLRRVCGEEGMRVAQLQAGRGIYALSLAKAVTGDGTVLAVEEDRSRRALIEESARVNGLSRLTVSGEDNEALASFLRNGCDVLIAEELTCDVKMMAEAAPLVMLRAGEHPEFAVTKMAEEGFDGYRLIPGPGLLAPLQDTGQPGSTRGWAFYCKRERAESLAAAGLLARGVPEDVRIPEAPDLWMAPFLNEAFAAQLLPVWRRRIESGLLPDDWRRLAAVLAAYHASRDGSRRPPDRYGLMVAAMALLRDTPGLANNPPRLSTFARLALDLGLHGAALDALNILIDRIREAGSFLPNEPFLPPTPYYEPIIHDGRLGNWLLAQALVVSDWLHHAGADGWKPNSALRNALLDLDMPATMASAVPVSCLRDRRPAGAGCFGRGAAAGAGDAMLFDASGWSAAVTRRLEQWRMDPDDAESLWHLRELRAQFAGTCEGAGGAANVDALLERGAEEGFRAMLESPFRYEPLEAHERDIAQRLRQALEKARGCDCARILAPAMTFFFPHDIPICRDITSLPPKLLELYLDFMWQPVSPFRRPGEAIAYTRHMQAWVDLLHGKIACPSGTRRRRAWRRIGAHALRHANFLSLYHGGGSLREIMTQRAEIMAAVLGGEPGITLEHACSARPPDRRRIRLGVLATHYSPQTETYAMLPHYGFLDRDEFEVVLFGLSESGHPLERSCRERADAFVLLEGSVARMAEEIRRHDLDILLFGTNVCTVTREVTLLAMHRLARIQVANHIQPTTTGMTHMDFFLSGTWTESDAAAHYVETPVLMKGPGFCFHFPDGAGPADTDAAGARKAHGLPDDAVVFMSGANCMKLVPELLDTWARVLAETSGSVLALYPFNPNWAATYNARAYIGCIRDSLAGFGVDPGRLVILRKTPERSGVFSYLACADIYLDSFPLTGATSLIDPLLAGLPAVTMDGTCLRFREAQSMLRAIGMEAFIASDEDEYVSKAVSLANEAAFREETRARIRERMAEAPSFLDAGRFSTRAGEAYIGMMRQRGFL